MGLKEWGVRPIETSCIRCGRGSKGHPNSRSMGVTVERNTTWEIRTEGKE